MGEILSRLYVVAFFHMFSGDRIPEVEYTKEEIETW